MEGDRDAKKLAEALRLRKGEPLPVAQGEPLRDAKRGGGDPEALAVEVGDAEGGTREGLAEAVAGATLGVSLMSGEGDAEAEGQGEGVAVSHRDCDARGEREGDVERDGEREPSEDAEPEREKEGLPEPVCVPELRAEAERPLAVPDTQELVDTTLVEECVTEPEMLPEALGEPLGVTVPEGLRVPTTEGEYVREAVGEVDAEGQSVDEGLTPRGVGLTTPDAV